MRRIFAVALCAAFLSVPVSAEKAPCPPREAGQQFPWQDLKPVKGDQFAWIYIDVDRSGRPLRCSVGENNIPDPETRFRVCLAYRGDWRAPPADSSDPATRTIKRHFTMIGYEHQMADRKARRQWFRDHPDERPDCYPD